MKKRAATTIAPTRKFENTRLFTSFYHCASHSARGAALPLNGDRLQKVPMGARQRPDDGEDRTTSQRGFSYRATLGIYLRRRNSVEIVVFRTNDFGVTDESPPSSR